MTITTFRAPGLYIQGPGALDLLGEKAGVLGRRATLICDADVLPFFQERIIRSLREAGVAENLLPFRGPVTLAALDGLAAAAGGDADLVIGLGGGRAMDAAKSTARLGRPVMTVPTVASTDAPAARGIAVYDDQHRVVTVEQLTESPACVLVDTAVIASAPARFLRAGIGDALTKKFEAEAVVAGSGLNKHGTRPGNAPLLMGDACYQVVRKHSAAALRAAERGTPDAELEAIVEAIILLSPMTFENSGLSLAHALAPALALHPATRQALHGEHAAYGTLVQILAEGRPRAECDEIRGFCRNIGLPVCLTDLGLSGASAMEITGFARACLCSPHRTNMPAGLSLEDVKAVIYLLESQAAEEPSRGRV